jgi:GTPase involved in cell partitioning and DNA repair
MSNLSEEKKAKIVEKERFREEQCQRVEKKKTSPMVNWVKNIIIVLLLLFIIGAISNSIDSKATIRSLEQDISNYQELVTTDDKIIVVMSDLITICSEASSSFLQGNLKEAKIIVGGVSAKNDELDELQERRREHYLEL